MKIIECSRPELARNCGQIAAGSGIITEIKPGALVLITNVTVQIAKTGEHIQLDHLHLKTNIEACVVGDFVHFFGNITEYKRGDGTRDFTIQCRPYNCHPAKVAEYICYVESYLASWLTKLRPLLVLQKVGNWDAVTNKLNRTEPIPQHVVEDVLEMATNIQWIIGEIRGRRFYAVNTQSLPELLESLERLLHNVKSASTIMTKLRQFHMTLLSSKSKKKSKSKK